VPEPRAWHSACRVGNTNQILVRFVLTLALLSSFTSAQVLFPSANVVLRRLVWALLILQRLLGAGHGRSAAGPAQT
jgi:hypothetical protein